MLIAHYGHRLPANYDIGLIHERAQRGSPRWDAVPDLHFKGFLLRQSGRFGAIGSSYSSLYLWRQDAAFRDFLVSGAFRIVTDAFGRPDIQTWFALDACAGRGGQARYLYKEEQDIPLDADLTSAHAAAIERNRDTAKRHGVVAAAVGVDAQRWRYVRVMLTESEPASTDRGTIFEVLYLARPLLGELPGAG